MKSPKITVFISVEERFFFHLWHSVIQKNFLPFSVGIEIESWEVNKINREHIH